MNYHSLQTYSSYSFWISYAISLLVVCIIHYVQNINDYSISYNVLSLDLGGYYLDLRHFIQLNDNKEENIRRIAKSVTSNIILLILFVTLNQIKYSLKYLNIYFIAFCISLYRLDFYQ